VSEPLARARHTETEAVFDIVLDDSGDLRAVPPTADSGPMFVGSLPASVIDSALAGSWRHFKGGEYEFFARVASSDEELVLYQDGRADCWLRPLAMVSEVVERDGQRLPRFARIT